VLDALRIRDFRYLWAGLTVSNVGGWMQIFALGLLVVQIAERDGVPGLAPFYLGLVGLARALPGIPCTLIAGAVADRFDRRKIIFIAQATMAVAAGVLAILTYLGQASLAAVLVAATVQSAAFAFDNPARQSMVPRIVPMAMYPSAIGLQSAAFNGASIIGPLIAGVLYVPIGIAGLLAANAISFAAIIFAILVLPAVPPLQRTSHGIFRSVIEGGRYVRSDRTLVWVLTIAGTAFVAAGPTSALLPALAGESLLNGMSWLSLLLTAMGAGAFLAAFVTMNVGRMRGLGRIYVLAAVCNGLALIMFALTVQPMLALVFAFFTGMCGTLVAGMGNNMIQTTVDDAYRGRIMSLWGLLFIGLMPIGQLALGAIGSLLGIREALVVGGAITLAAGVYAWLRVPVLRDWRSRPRKRVAQVPTVAVGQPTFR
jgi:MFS family permease